MYRQTIHSAVETNGPVVTEILALRQELVEPLGYPTSSNAPRRPDGAEPQALLDDLVAPTDLRPTGNTGSCLPSPGPTPATTPWSRPPPMWTTRSTILRHQARESLGSASAASVNVPVETAHEVSGRARRAVHGDVHPFDAAGWHADVEAFDLRDGAGRHLVGIFWDRSLREGKRPFGG
jgi:hypothetical protein